jgi:hypothetical protein
MNSIILLKIKKLYLIKGCFVKRKNLIKEINEVKKFKFFKRRKRFKTEKINFKKYFKNKINSIFNFINL